MERESRNGVVPSADLGSDFGQRNLIPALLFCHVTLTAAKTKTYDPLTLGEHIKKTRIERRPAQSNAVAFLSVSVKTTPEVKHWPAIMDFLGYCPYQSARSLGDRLRLHRMHRGLTIEELAEMLEVDPGSLSRWETSEREPREKYREIIAKFLATPR